MANFPGVDPKMYEEVSSYLQEQEQRNPEAFKQLGGFNGFVRTMVGAARALERDPEGAIRYLANHHGIDLARLGPNPDELSQMRNGYSQFQQYQQQWVQQQQQARQQKQAQRFNWLERECESFKAEKGYWNESFETAVLQQIEAIKATNPGRVMIDPIGVLKEAESRAIKVTGISTQSSMAELKKKADEAKRLASINVRSKGIRGAAPANQSMRQTMTDVFERLHGSRKSPN